MPTPAGGSRTARRTGSLVALGAAGLLASARAEVTLLGGAQDGGGPLACPFRALTGLPCPLCGSTRALALVTELDPGFLRLNAVVALVVVLALAGGLLVALQPRWGPRLAARAPARRPLAALAVFGALAWIVTLANRGAITG